MAVMDNIDGWNEDCAGVSRTRHRRRDPLVAFRTPFASTRMKVLGFRVLLSLLEEFFFFLTQRCSCRQGRDGNGRRKDRGSDDDEELFKKRILKERNWWLTPTGSCAPDEAEEEEEKFIRTPPGVSDPITRHV